MDAFGDTGQEFKKDHARWSTEHGHWRKDAQVWREEHEKIIAVTTPLAAIAEEFDRLSSQFERDVENHEEEVRLHELALEGSSHPPKAGQRLHAKGPERHDHEQEVHRKLLLLHERILSEAQEIGDFVRSLR